MATNTVLITGGAGFIGSRLSHALVDEFDEVVVVDNFSPQVHNGRHFSDDLHPRATVIEGDITEGATWGRVLDHVHPRVVVHLAAETGTAQSYDEATLHGMTNVVGTTRMLDALAGAGAAPEQIILASSRAVYGEGARRLTDGAIVPADARTTIDLENGIWAPENSSPVPMDARFTPIRPVSIYGATKFAQELLLGAWTTPRAVKLGILRLQNVYGAGQSATNSYTGILPLFCGFARASTSIPLYEDGEILRDFIHVSDVVDGLRLAIASGSSGTWDLGSGDPVTIRQVASLIADRYEAPAPVVTGQFRPGDVRAASADNSRALADLGWAPKVSLCEGLAELTTWLDVNIG
jgi:dTDP-L-rhamnose 4-epimerase